ncbi:MAG: thioredoxin family protein [Syntrophorhabdaceae bacterium]|nr:thioredoxin family protein [Syntrophorhabdaceae bacterium]
MKSKAVIIFAIVSILAASGIITAPDVLAAETKGGQKAATTTRQPAAAPVAVKYPALVDVGAKQCIPCKMMEPILEELRTEYAGSLRVEFIDVQVDPETATKLGVRGIPTQIFYDASGKERYRHMGYFSKDAILETFKKLRIELVKKGPAKKTK